MEQCFLATALTDGAVEWTSPMTDWAAAATERTRYAVDWNLATIEQTQSETEWVQATTKRVRRGIAPAPAVAE